MIKIGSTILIFSMFGTIKQSSMDLVPSKTFPKGLLKFSLRHYVSDLFLIDYIDMKKFISDKKSPKKIKFGCFVVAKWSKVWIFVTFFSYKRLIPNA